MPDDPSTPTGVCLHVPKAGHTADEYEDAAALACDDWPAYAAVADGATESAFARIWAEQLAAGATDAGVTTAEALRAELPAWQTAWRGAVDARTDALPWYAAAKAADGAFATLLACTLHAEGTWQALSVGDCALFHVRDGALLASWPVDDADAFTNRPALLPSQPIAAVPDAETTSGRWQPGDVLVLATDAAAAWLLRTDPARALSLTADAFADAVADARTTGTLRNDDTTLLRLHCPPATP